MITHANHTQSCMDGQAKEVLYCREADFLAKEVLVLQRSGLAYLTLAIPFSSPSFFHTISLSRVR
jgi:hypothetical protein